jgi:NADH-quinone oxidoreductase subunit F
VKAAVEIRVGLGSCGVASGAEPVRDALFEVAEQAGVDGVVKTVGCNGMCHREPMVEVVSPDGKATLYGNVHPETARAIARAHLRPTSFAVRLRWSAASAAEGFGKQRTAPSRGACQLDRRSGPAGSYLGKQRRIVLEN